MYNEKKQLSTIHMLDSLLSAQVAYYDDPTELNMQAVQASKAAVNAMLSSYYMGEEGSAHGKE